MAKDVDWTKLTDKEKADWFDNSYKYFYNLDPARRQRKLVQIAKERRLLKGPAHKKKK